MENDMFYWSRSWSCSGVDVTEYLNLNGQCMCGAVRVNAVCKRPKIAVCHCNMCRRWSSGPFMSVNCSDAEFKGEISINRIRSSEWAERGFCKECGSNLFYHIVGQSDYQIAAGLFGDLGEFRMALQLFVDEKPSFYSFSEDTKCMTAAEVLELYASKEK